MACLNLNRDGITENIDANFINQKVKTRVILAVHANMFNSSSKSQGPCIVAPPTLKSNLKNKTTSVEENHDLRNGRKVSWPDIAHGKDLAQVQVYEYCSSVLEEGESEGGRNSCTCAIQ
ncbi:uncharacterized protein LOC122092069 [Macadamia integrifolia]|uniref:uncharacterized protein LOC122092069 n=1 Tax=Macadamia integrifolia TaxID=60698 RepID=UPI001C4F4036|nr:uncharacterized protein LOC122092069 [Macadamia integrifolia]